MHRVFALIVVSPLLPLLVVAQPQPAAPTQRDRSSLQVEKLASLEYPWGLARLPDGRLLITEKPGRLRVFADGALSDPIQNVPKTAYRQNENEQGGLLDVAVDPDFARNRHIYLSYAEEAAQPAATADPGDPRFSKASGGSDRRLMGGAVARATVDGPRLTDVKVIWRQEPKTVGRGHFGHRLLFGRDGTLFVTSGERMRFDPAQSQTSNLGKVVRINKDGSTPRDNPFAGTSGVRGEIWSLGHRNILSAAIEPSSGQLWVVEMGPLGGDELNRIERGKNYGWPEVSDGDNYDKSPIPDHASRPEFTAPIRTWTPVISPSGALFYEGSLFPWKGDLLVGGLSSKGLIRLTLQGGQVTSEERIELGQRVRDVIEASGGAVFVITDAQDGALLRLTPPTTPVP